MISTNTICDGYQPPSALSLTTATLSCILCPVTIVGNVLVVLAVLLDPFRQLRTQFNFYVVSLAIADLVVGCITEPLSIILHYKEASGLNINEMKELTMTLHFSYFLSVTASLLNLSALSVDRIISIRHPIQYRAKFSLKKNLGVIGILWTISFSLSLSYFYLGFIMMGLILGSVSVFVTLTVLIATVGVLHFTLKRRFSNVSGKNSGQFDERRRKTLTTFSTQFVLSSVRTDDTVSSDKVSERENRFSIASISGRLRSKSIDFSTTIKAKIQTISHRSNIYRVNEIQKHQTKSGKLLVVLVTMLIAFLSCFIPSYGLAMYLNFGSVTDCLVLNWFKDLHFVFAITGSMINPFIYTWRLTAFRRAISYFFTFSSTKQRRISQQSRTSGVI